MLLSAKDFSYFEVVFSFSLIPIKFSVSLMWPTLLKPSFHKNNKAKR